ncbi:MAG: 1,4-dihydroxy-2-naphthoate octaprenyltransferase [Paracoccaceae bacterium]|jgi:1,4-dihydroxy-2-naphthoate octaprenyltransferase
MTIPVWKAWLMAARPKTLPAAIVPVWAGSLLAWHLTGNFDLRLAVVTVMGAIFIQIATNFFNDVIDAEKGADTADRIGPQRATSSGLLSRKSVYTGAIFMLLQAVVCGFFLYQVRGWAILVIGIPSLYLSYGYTGGPLPLAYRGLGEVFVILFFGLVAVMGTVFIQTGVWPWQGAVLGLQIGLLSAVLIAVNNYRDLEEDRAADKRTLVVRWGRRPVKKLIFLMTIAPAFLVSVIGGFGWWLIVAMILGGVFFLLERRLLQPEGVSSKLLGLSALHLILFVIAQNVCLVLT